MKTSWMFFGLICTIPVRISDSSETRALEFLYITYSVPDNDPWFEQTTVLDGEVISHCNKSSLRETPRNVLIYEQFSKEDMQIMNNYCQREHMEQTYRHRKIKSLTILTVETLQRHRSCSVHGPDVFLQDRWGLNGENFMTFDPKSVSWRADSPLAIPVERHWNMNDFQSYNMLCKQFLQKYCLSMLRNFTNTQGETQGHKKNTEIYIFAKHIPLTETVLLTCQVNYRERSDPHMQLISNGETLTTGVERRSPRPNGDGTLQLSIRTEVKTTANRTSYSCIATTETWTLQTEWAGQALHEKPYHESSFHETMSILKTVGILLIIGPLTLIFAIVVKCSLRAREQRINNNNTNIYYLHESDERFWRDVSADDEHYVPMCHLRDRQFNMFRDMTPRVTVV